MQTYPIERTWGHVINGESKRVGCCESAIRDMVKVLADEVLIVGDSVEPAEGERMRFTLIGTPNAFLVEFSNVAR